MKIQNVNRISSALVATAAVILSAAQSAQAAPCVFLESTKSKAMTLTASCTTDHTIVIANGKTLNGQGFKITAVDPVGGTFVGPIIKNAGKAAGLTNLFLRTNLANVCNSDADKVVGVLFEKTVGTIAGLNVQVTKGLPGESSCAEGLGLVVQSLPFSPSAPFNKVTVKGGTFKENQLGAIAILGNVNARIESNLIKDDTANVLVRRGVEVAAGAKAYILNNEILRISHSPMNDVPSFGILLHEAGASTIQTNILNYNDYAIRVVGGTRITLKNNIIASSVVDGILVDDANGLPTTAITVWGNNVQKSGRHGIYLWSPTGMLTKNIVKSNYVSRNSGNGLLMEGKANKAQVNTATTNSIHDIGDAGIGNLYSKNVCATRSGPPVDCGAP